MRAALVFVRDATEHRFELSEDLITIGRGADCQLRLPDERVSTRHCRVSWREDAWWIEDLESTNRTFVNDEQLPARPERLHHGDTVRLGARDAQLFEARFLLHDASEQHRAAAQQVAEGIHRRNVELEAQLAARAAEISRLSAMCARLQAQLADGERAAAASQRIAATTSAEMDELRRQLAVERNEHAACREQRQREQQRCKELEARLDAQAYSARNDQDVAQRSRNELEVRLRNADAELATLRVALSTATDNVRALQQAHNEALLRLDAMDGERSDR
jgi:pSer/pThr/pTyr-binding forkhead associated (FHA) protein